MMLVRITKDLIFYISQFLAAKPETSGSLRWDQVTPRVTMSRVAPLNISKHRISPIQPSIGIRLY